MIRGAVVATLLAAFTRMSDFPADVQEAAAEFCEMQSQSGHSRS